MDKKGYIGRFAPSPTGPLHFGSLVAAMGSYLRARTLNGQWLVRIEDLDKPREVTGASDDILRTLDDLGFEWDDLIYQSDNTKLYEHYLHELQANNSVYACQCSRKQISAAASPSAPSQTLFPQTIYPGTCRHEKLSFSEQKAIRLDVSQSQKITFQDKIQPPYSQNLQDSIGDFPLKRRDGFYAYQLAVVVDDHVEGVTEVVRGMDLFDNTPRQIYLQQKLKFKTPDYLHLPIVLTAQGDKLSKQALAPRLDRNKQLLELTQAFYFLNPNTPLIIHESKEKFWQYAIKNWAIEAIPTTEKGFPVSG